MDTRRRLEQIIEDEMRTEAKKEELTALAEHIAHNFLVLSTVQHDPVIERDQLERIASQVFKTTEVEMRDFEQARRLLSMEKLLKNLIVAELHKTVGQVTEQVLNDLAKEKTLLKDIEYIVRSKDPSKLRLLEELIHNLLQIIHITDENMQREDNTLRRAA